MDFKKPSITKGKWKINKEIDKDWKEEYFYLYGNDKPLATIYGDNAVWLTKDEEIANGKAISAVPEMIDALIESYKMLHSLLDDRHTQELCNMRDLVCEKLDNDETLNQIKESLTKAGCVQCNTQLNKN